MSGLALLWRTTIRSGLLRLVLHDQKHGTSLITGTTQDFPTPGTVTFEPVVCQQCHYTPALDLAQLGPLGPENDFAADFVNSDLPGGIISSPSVANGRDQVKHKSMSNVMHSHHGSLGVFPTIDAPIQDGLGGVATLIRHQSRGGAEVGVLLRQIRPSVRLCLLSLLRRPAFRTCLTMNRNSAN